MKKWEQILAFLILFSVIPAMRAQVQAYQIFTKEGKKVSFEKMVKQLSEQQVILFGEYHNNPISHWLQLELLQALHQKKMPIKIGAEMFERDEQEALNKYMAGLISVKELDSLNGGLWRNFQTDYKPLVDFAKKHSYEFWGTNIPRRFASLVYKGGFEALDSLSVKEKEWIAKLPIAFDNTLPGYAQINKMAGGHGGDNLAKSQAIKDATMAETISRFYIPTGIYVHFNGAYHSNNYEGIYWYLKQSIPGMRIGTITTVSQAQTKKLQKENYGLADFIICVDEDMTTTY